MCVLRRFFGRASNRLSLPNLQNLTIFKGEGADAEGSETGRATAAAVIFLSLSLKSIDYW